MGRTILNVGVFLFAVFYLFVFIEKLVSAISNHVMYFEFTDLVELVSVGIPAISYSISLFVKNNAVFKYLWIASIVPIVYLSTIMNYNGTLFVISVFSLLFVFVSGRFINHKNDDPVSVFFIPIKINNKALIVFGSIFLLLVMALMSLNGRYRHIGNGRIIDNWKREILIIGSDEVPIIYNNENVSKK